MLNGNQLIVLAECYVCELLVDKLPDWKLKAIEQLISAGMLARNLNARVTTEKGEVFIKHILSLPIPVKSEIWVMPSTG